MDGGRPIDAAIKDILNNANTWLSDHLRRMSLAFQQGLKPYEALDTGILIEDEMGLIRGFSEAGSLDQELPKMGKRTVERSIKKIQSAGRVINTIMLLTTGGVLIWIYLAMFLSLGSVIANNPLT